jgi:L-cysteine:1D-myo-inositol 2-amino-2-deoxy-alpha-D-glucopyranoside ligase
MDSWRAARFPELPGRAPEPKVRDTSSGRLVTAAAGQVATLYACGITPYDATHIGHAATYIAWDLLVRVWRDAGHQVNYAQNVTDVDDPLLERAARDGEDWRELANREIALYRSDMEALRVLPPAYYVGAVEALDVIERFNRLLADHGALYELDGDVYFARSADSAFGAVARLDTPAMLALAAERGGDPARPGKKDPLDPLVWVAARAGEPAWDSEFGSGRPGWHVECAAIATEYLGASFDIQAGGSDLAFPHHEMSASHARVALGGASGPGGPDGPDGPGGASGASGPGGLAGADGSGAVFARAYVHAGMVRLDGEKMSKSRGNLVFVSRLLAAGTDPMAIRLAILAHHYADDWDWTEEGLAAAVARLARWRRAVALAGGLPRSSSAPLPAAPSGPDTPAAVSEAAPTVIPGAAPTVVPDAAPTVVPQAAPMVVPDEALTVVPGAALTAEDVIVAVRARLADDLDAPGALAVVDSWADAIVAAADQIAPGQRTPTTAAQPARDRLEVRQPGAESRARDGQLVRDTIDALLGIAL